jgi:hypothetical protein
VARIGRRTARSTIRRAYWTGRPGRITDAAAQWLAPWAGQIGGDRIEVGAHGVLCSDWVGGLDGVEHVLVLGEGFAAAAVVDAGKSRRFLEGRKASL